MGYRVKLPTRDQRDLAEVGRRATVIGWGSTQQRQT